MSRPLIGITTHRRDSDEGKKDVFGLMAAYVDSVRNNGGLPVLVPLGSSEPELRDLFERLDGVMIGRAAIGNPWIFARRERRDVPFGEVADMIRRHLSLSLEFYGLAEGFSLFRRHAHKYIFAIPMADSLRNALANARSPEVVLRTIEKYEAGMAITA
ncbi:MAG: tRNA-dihydrouridine synthase [Chloroflexi bacterium]|nr:tRNA-dihydrouridine synthase [Chloroflexota bacterium]